VFGRFLPKETSFFDLFEQHAALTVEGIKELVSLVSSGANVSAKAKRIADIEHETDVITHRSGSSSPPTAASRSAPRSAAGGS
jgi:hypothetical protein